MFGKLLSERINRGLNEWHSDNYDIERFGKRKLKRLVKERLRVMLGRHRKNLPRKTKKIEPYISRLEDTWRTLEDVESKDLLVDLMAYHVLGYRHIKLAMNSPDYWTTLRRYMQTIENSPERIETGFRDFWLGRTQINEFGVNVEAFVRSNSIMSQLFLSQYELNRNGLTIGVKPDDTVMDCGACWGESSLFFAFKSGESGRVFSFEFIPGNLDIFKRNISLNEQFSERIKIIEKPLWSAAGGELYFSDNGPGSKIATEPFQEMAGTVQLTTIDETVRVEKLEKLDFIKMDIEGAELNALKGATDSLVRFKPDLAISLYHSLDDFCDVPAYLKSLNLGYKFYLHHATIHNEETVLFASVNV